jgi:hypothetical protein
LALKKLFFCSCLLTYVVLNCIIETSTTHMNRGGIRPSCLLEILQSNGGTQLCNQLRWGIMGADMGSGVLGGNRAVVRMAAECTESHCGHRYFLGLTEAMSSFPRKICILYKSHRCS